MDKDYQILIKQSIAETIEINNDANPNTLWELIKGAIRNVAIKFATAKTKKDIKNETNLKHEIENIEAKLLTLLKVNDIEQTQKLLVEKNKHSRKLLTKKLMD